MRTTRHSNTEQKDRHNQVLILQIASISLDEFNILYEDIIYVR